jgi:hypothetical protein
VIRQVLEARMGKMATANKLAVLLKIRQEESVLFGSFLSDLTKQKEI